MSIEPRRPLEPPALEVIDKRLARTHSHFRKESKSWRDLAAQAVR